MKGHEETRPVESELSIDHRADWKAEHRSNESAARQRLTTTRLAITFPPLGCSSAVAWIEANDQHKG
jgi:hypothetical protein